MTPLLAACVTGHAGIVDYLVQSKHLVSRKEKIEALELLGATYIDKKRDLIGGFDLWKRAMDLRFNVDDENDIPKPDNALPIEAYEWAQEVKNHEELNELLSEPDEMRMQVSKNFLIFSVKKIKFGFFFKEIDLNYRLFTGLAGQRKNSGSHAPGHQLLRTLPRRRVRRRR